MTTIRAPGRNVTVGDAVRRLNPQVFGDGGGKTCSQEVGVVAQQASVTNPKRIRQSSNPLLNKLETEFHERIKRDANLSNIRPQARRYKLGNGIWFKPDFTASCDGRETAWEVKGPHAFRGGLENLKVAAHQWPEVRWILAWKVNGQWMEQEVLP